MSFLPQNFGNLIQEKHYLKPSELKEGDNKIRIVYPAIAGWLEWFNKVPYRYRVENKPSAPKEKDGKIKPFWTLYVWSYEKEALYVMEITQIGMIKALIALGEDSDWGDFRNYDIKINKTGSLLKTQYTLTALPHKPLSNEIKNALEACPVCLDNLFDGGNPWDMSCVVNQTKQEEVIFTDNNSFKTKKEELFELFECESIEPTLLDDFLCVVSEKQKKSEDEVILSALNPDMWNKFKTAYLKYHKEYSEQ